MKLTSENVHSTFIGCLTSKTSKAEIKIGEGVMGKAVFSPEKLEKAKIEIIEMLKELPENFQVINGGGGYTFLNLCLNKDGEQWCNLHKTMDELIMLGNAIERVSFPLPKDLWLALPGGMPYVSVNSN